MGRHVPGTGEPSREVLRVVTVGSVFREERPNFGSVRLCLGRQPELHDGRLPVDGPIWRAVCRHSVVSIQQRAWLRTLVVLRPRSNVQSEDLQAASDAQLVVAVGRFHHDALAEAYRRHAGPAFGLAVRITNDRVLAEEVVQEVFLRLWNNPERFDPARDACAYLLAQTHGRSVDLVRAESARRGREARDARRSPGVGYDLEREVVELALAEQVREALAELADAERAAIELAYFGGHTYREVAALLGEPEGTVKSRIRTGLGRLRESLVASGAAGSGGPWAES